MKKIYALLAVMVLGLSVSFVASAIEEPDAFGTITVSAYGAPKFVFGVNLFSGIDRIHWGVTAAATGDFVITDKIWKGHLCTGLAFGGFVCPDMKLDSGTEFRSAFTLAPRITYGLNLWERIEVHAGFSAGPYLHTEQVTYSNGTKKYDKPSSFRFTAGVIVGIRYYLSERFALAAEVDSQIGLPTLGLGASFKF